jgi:hypothetical protein
MCARGTLEIAPAVLSRDYSHIGQYKSRRGGRKVYSFEFSVLSFQFEEEAPSLTVDHRAGRLRFHVSPTAPQRIEVRRINVSAALFLSIQFQETGYYIQAEMVRAFLSSIEYRQRFGQPYGIFDF